MPCPFPHLLPPGAHGILTPRRDNQKCLQTLPVVPGGHKRRWRQMPRSFSLRPRAGVRSPYFSATHCSLHRKCRLRPEAAEEGLWTQAQALCAPGSRPAGSVEFDHLRNPVKQELLSSDFITEETEGLQDSPGHEH